MSTQFAPQVPNVNQTSPEDDEEIYAEAGGTRRSFAPCPAGQQQMVLVDVRSLGLIEVIWEGVSKGMKPHVLFTFQVNERINLPIEPTDTEDDIKFKNRMNGQLYVVSQTLLNSFADKAKMKKWVEAIIGRKLTAAEVAPQGFKLTRLIGANCTGQIIHKEGKGKNEGTTFANIDNIIGWNTKFGPNMVAENYTRYKDRPKGADGKPLRGAELEKYNLANQMVALLAEGELLGMKPSQPIDVSTLSVEALRASVPQWETAIANAKGNAQTETAMYAAPAEAPEAPKVKGKQPMPSKTPAIDAFKLRTGNDPDPFEEDEDAEGFIPDGPEREAILRELDPKKTTLAQGIAAAAAPTEMSDEDKDVFDQDFGTIANSQWVAAGNPPLADYHLHIFTAAEDAELPLASSKMMVTDEAFVAAINEFLASKNRPAVENVVGLKTPQSKIVAAAIEKGEISF